MPSTNHIAAFLSFNVSKTWSYKADFLHAGTYLLKLQIDDEVLSGRGQACPSMSKEAIKTCRGSI